MIVKINEVKAVASDVTSPVPETWSSPSLTTADDARTAAGAAVVPWYIWCSLAAVTSVMIGGYWDIAWHMTIGRDSFWTPPHMLIYFCGVLAGFSSGYLILSTTFGDTAARETSVNIWGLRAPLGAFISAWGGLAMITSAPLDNWWHNAYGLDVKIFSPPHLVLDTGVLAVEIGGLVLIAATMNRAQEALREKLDWLYLYLGAMMVSLGLAVVWERTYRILMHNSRCYRAVALMVPVLLVGAARASRRRWASTIMMAIYSAYTMVMLWIMPLFPAEPKLGPVYQRVTHFVPMEFPLLLIVPAFFLDYLWPKLAGRNKWSGALVAGLVFLVTFVTVQWPFASFLLSPLSRNWFFGTHYFAYFQPPESYAVRHLFYLAEPGPGGLWLGMVEALVAAIVSTRLGLALGDWMRRIRR